MQLKVHNLGRIRDFAFDVSPLTVFYGPNGTNKTWVTTVLAAVLKSHAARTGTVLETSPVQDPERRAHLEMSIAPLLTALKAGSSIDRVDAEFDLEAHFAGDGGLGTALPVEPVERFLGTVDALAPDALIDVEVSRSDTRGALPTFRLTFEPGRNLLDVVRIRGDSVTHSQHTTNWTAEALAAQARALRSSFFETVLFQPADRAGLATAYSALDPTRIASLPFSSRLYLNDYVRLLWQKGSSSSFGLEAILDRELGGAISARETGDAREVVLELTGGRTLPIQAAASFARTNAALALYLQKAAQVDDVLLIDELELNAHPEAQLALTELMAMLVNAGVRVVFTTHSPYVVDHLNLLMEASRLPEGERERFVSRLRLKRADALIKPELVAAYSFENAPDGSVNVQRSVDLETGLLATETFARVSRREDKLFSDILDAEEPHA